MQAPEQTAEMLEVDAESGETTAEAYARHGWGDGLPLEAPTKERVTAMLAAAGGADPDEAIAVLAPREGVATRRVIAVNAVAAGCGPEHFSVLVAAVRALAAPELNLRGVNATTHPVAPMLVVHGAAAAEGGYNSGLGAYGPGNRANAATGRALRLILMHTAGAVPGDGDASTQGGPAKYAYCVAENIEASPWGGYARSVGLGSPSAVTIHCGEAPHNVHDMESDSPARILDKVASAMCSTAANNAPISSGEYFVMLCPEHAAVCAADGWSRDDVAAYLFNRGRMQVGELRRAFDLRAWAPWQQRLGDDDTMPMTESAANIKVMVLGGAGKHSSLIPSWGMTRSVTMAVEP